MKNGKKKPSIVFCHGIWADGSCFSKLIHTLQEEGYEVVAAQYFLSTLASDVAMVKGSLGRVSSPAILVGHSYGGSVITAAGVDDRVAGLVYIAALWPDAITVNFYQDETPCPAAATCFVQYAAPARLANKLSDNISISK